MPAKKSAQRAKSAKPESPSKLIDARIKELPDWRGEVLSRMRRLIQQAGPEVVEEWKWRGVPVWSHDGMICTGETYRNVVKLTFAKGASLKDPAGLFNASLEGNARRAIDLHEGDEIDGRAFQSLVSAAAALNASKAKRMATGSKGERSTATKGKNIFDCTMKNDEIEARDRAELKFMGSIPENGHSTPVEAVAGREGITIDEYVLIPWEWIDRARKAATA